ncbi:hypothetical protein MTP99_007904 [Tenebrio molitor]|nr:hypothetical protein MTP99_007904 [Tenebrio molitor]
MRVSSVKSCYRPGPTRHRFPNPRKYAQRFDEWLKRTGNSELLMLDPWKVYNHHMICCLYFKIGVRLRYEPNNSPASRHPSEGRYRPTRTAWRVTQWTEIPPTSGAHLSVGSNFQENGSVGRKPGSGRPKKRTPEVIEEARQAMEEAPRTSIEHLSQQLELLVQSFLKEISMLQDTEMKF